MKFIPIFVPALLAFLPAVQGAVSFNLQFSSSSGALTGIADETGSTAPDLSWGILIAESGSDFSSPISTELGISTIDGAELLEGFQFFSGGETFTFPLGGESGGGAVSNEDFSIPNPFDTGDSFALIWFERGFTSGDTLQAGDKYGLLTNPEFILPSEGDATPIGLEFVGSDPVRSASLVVVPEPSSLMMLSLSLLALTKRRRS